MNVHLYGPMHLIEGLAHLYRRGTRITNLSAKVAQLSELSDAYRQAVSNVSDPYVPTSRHTMLATLSRCPACWCSVSFTCRCWFTPSSGC